MKKTILPFIAMLVCTALYAQPREMGLRIGAGGLEAAYQHELYSTQFIEADLGMDLGYNLNGRPGIKATASYNFIWAQPAWTAKGIWSIYSGPGMTLGYVDDIVPYEISGKMKGYYDEGFMIGFVVNVGVEYMFTVPLSITLDVRPCVAVHMNEGRIKLPGTDMYADSKGKAGFYDNGLLGFIPSISIRYRF